MTAEAPTLIVLRPEPGAGETRARAEAAGWRVIVAPLFAVRALDWKAPEASRFDAVLVTSANAVRHGGDRLADYAALPVYAVGEASAAAAGAAGFDDVTAASGNASGDAGSAADMLRGDGRRRVLHLAGREVRGFGESGLIVTRVAVYAAEPATPEGLSEAMAGWGAVALLHSARAAARFAMLFDEAGMARGDVRLIAISAEVAAAAGAGWREVVVAETKDDAAMLQAAEGLRV